MRKFKELFVVTVMSLSIVGLSACGAASESGEAQKSEAMTEESADTSAGSTVEESVDVSTETSVEAETEGSIKELSEGDKAPDFTAELVDGTEFKLSEHENEVVLLNFFASWCPPCMGEMPAFEKLKKDNIEGLSILCVNCMEDKATVDQLVKDEGYTFPIAYDVEGKIGQLYPTEGIPYTLVIKNGVIEKIYLGADGADKQYAEYKGAIDECMK